MISFENYLRGIKYLIKKPRSCSLSSIVGVEKAQLWIALGLMVVLIAIIGLISVVCCCVVIALHSLLR